MRACHLLLTDQQSLVFASATAESSLRDLRSRVFHQFRNGAGKSVGQIGVQPGPQHREHKHVVFATVQQNLTFYECFMMCPP